MNKCVTQKAFKILALLFLGGLLALIGVGLINVAVDKPIEVHPERLSGKSPLFKNAAPIIQESCLNCHSAHAQLPWYASFPLAKQKIENNIAEGREEIDLEKVLFTPGKVPSAKAMHHIQSEIEKNAMPPREYKALHWKAVISKKEKQAILNWIREEQNVKLSN